MPDDVEELLKEQNRLDSLQRYDILDTPQEEAFDRITRLVRKFFDVPMSTITFIDGHRQWFKSHQGMEVCEGDRGPALCAAAIAQDEPLVIPDTLADPRFASNVLVTGEPRIRFYAGVPLYTPDRQNIGTLCAADTRPRKISKDHVAVLSDLAKIVMSELELRLLATTDGLTGALSRRGFREEASRAVALALRYRYDLSLIMFDLDHFKVINDTHGHPTGDRVLRTTVATCDGVLRKSDLVGRMGGEEFAILLPHTNVTAAMDVADKLRSAVASQRLHTAFGPLRISGSFGVAGLDRCDVEIDSLLQNADVALYDAKAGGRNRCVAWTPLRGGTLTSRPNVLKAGRISYDGGEACLDCTVRTLSESGAGVDVISSADIPDLFQLQIEAVGFSGPCRVARKTDRHLELDFS